MTSEARSLIDELDAALSKASDSRHLTILRRVTDLFLRGLETFSNDHVAIFDDVISRLIEKTEHPALIELSARLAPLGNAPLNVIAHLSCNDDFAVSGPILENSNVLTDSTLAEIAKTKSQKHLVAIAGRPQLSETVTDPLVDRGSSEVAHKVTANPGARLSELGFVKLIGRAKTDKALAEAIANRIDLPPELEPFLRLALAP
jgi:uncharacterized protein (DUF2336 family)